MHTGCTRANQGSTVEGHSLELPSLTRRKASTASRSSRSMTVFSRIEAAASCLAVIVAPENLAPERSAPSKQVCDSRPSMKAASRRKAPRKSPKRRSVPENCASTRWAPGNRVVRGPSAPPISQNLLFEKFAPSRKVAPEKSMHGISASMSRSPFRVTPRRSIQFFGCVSTFALRAFTGSRPGSPSRCTSHSFVKRGWSLLLLLLLSM